MRRGLAVITVLAAIWAAAIWLSDGFAISIGGVRFSSSDPVRPLIVAIIAALTYLATSGFSLASAEVTRACQYLSPVRLAIALTVAILMVGIANNSWGAGGSDSYSYVSQMDLWLRGDLKVPVSMVTQVPWPNALATFTPFGYSAVAGENAIAPITGPGLPLLMAAFKVAGGHAMAFLVVPITGALLVWMTFLIGRRVHSDLIGLGAAWLVATSPTFLMMFKSQMSDVPVAAFWALATYWTLGRTARDAVFAGISTSIAILIRPNLAPIGGLLAAWPLVAVADLRSPRRFLLFSAAAIPGCVGVAVINTSLFGSPLSSGYGQLSTLFSFANVPTTLASYSRWLFETETPVVFAGAVVLLVAPSRVWATSCSRGAARFLGVLLLTVWALYAAYPAFDAWWFLRFLLPSWPPMCIGTVAAMVWLCNRDARWGHAATIIAVLALGAYGLRITAQRHVFTDDEGERRYATIAQLVASQTEPSAMILASIHAGSVRYYAGRATLRFDLLDEAWLDRTLRWLDEHGHHPYVLIEDWEMPGFRKRFAQNNGRLGDLRLAPALAYQAYRISGTVYLFDFLRSNGPTLAPPPIRDPRPRCPLPAEPPTL